MMFAAFGIEDMIPLLVFGGIVAGIWALMSLISNRNSQAVDRLNRLSRPQSLADIEDPTKAAETGGFEAMTDAVKLISQPLMPQTETEQNELKNSLANAGFRSEAAPMVYSGIRLVCLAVGFLISLAVFVPGRPFGFKMVAGIVIVTSIGFYIPSIILWYLRSARQQEIFLTLPDALDLLVVCVESGLGLDAAMRKVCDEMGEHAKVITEELSLANFQLQMGRPRREVLHDLGVRTGVDDVKSLAAILIQADRFGSSIAQALRVQSDSMRTRRKQMAEEQAAMTAVQLLFPLILFIFPGIFVVLVGPAAINIMENLLVQR
ncbi:MAG: type II secretion system F family protein [Planctomycetes bacterium]|nr:type II secretion system F family protein [Planctomycetota bacterium]